MSQENVEIVRRAFEVLAGGVRHGDPGAGFDQAAVEGLIASDLDWGAGRRAGVGVPGMGNAVGRKGWLEPMRTFTEDFEDYRSEAEQITDAGSDQVLVLVRSDGTGRGSGAHVEMRIGMVLTLTEGRIVRVNVFVKPADAIRAAGLAGVLLNEKRLAEAPLIPAGSFLVETALDSEEEQWQSD